MRLLLGRGENLAMVDIVGAGMAGLLAANMLRHRKPVVYEAQSSLPNNHSAVLRFRTPVVGQMIGGVKFRKVTVVKSVLPWRNPIADALAYSNKNLSLFRTSRSIVLPSEKEIVERYIAPPNLIELMARDIEIVYGHEYNFEAAETKPISTIPLPILLDLLNYDGPKPEFSYVHGVNVRARIPDCDAYATLYVPDPDLPFSRISITGDDLIVEIPRGWLTKDNWVGFYGGDKTVSSIAESAVKLLGMSTSNIRTPEVYEQRYAKIAEIDETARKDLVFWHSSVRGKAWALGRFATWRPGLLLDDLVDDVRKIDAWLGSRTPGYDMDLHHAR